MKGWRFFSLVLAVSLSGCSGVAHELFSQPTPPLAWQVPARPEMIINAEGNNVTLVVADSATLAVRTNNVAPPRLNMALTAKTLTLYFSKKSIFKPKSNVVITIPSNLQALTVEGSGSVRALALPASLQRLTIDGGGVVQLQGKSLSLHKLLLHSVKQARIDGIRSTDLLVSIRDSGAVTLHGIVGIRELQAENSGRVAITWVNSAQLLVNLSGKQQVFLAGVAGLLIAEVDGHAQLDAKYLRANKAFVNTHQEGLAEVFILDSLNAYAIDHSNIYYYQQPRLIGRYYQDHGSILYMGQQPPPCLSPECAPMPHSLPG